jgi:hypothetical protein
LICRIRRTFLNRECWFGVLIEAGLEQSQHLMTQKMRMMNIAIMQFPMRKTPPIHDAGMPLVIPVTAPLVTGHRAVVYVRVPEVEQPTFEPREIVLGPRVGEWYIVHEGLSRGELVVTNGSFKIDSELQIRGRPSMMQPEGGRLLCMIMVPLRLMLPNLPGEHRPEHSKQHHYSEDSLVSLCSPISIL